MIEYLDESLCQNRLTDEVAKLRKLQLADGSFAWWKGMEGSRYMTTEVAEMMVRLNRMVGVQQETKDMLTAALRYLQRKAAAEVKDMKKEAEKKRNVRPSELAIHYLYILSLDGRNLIRQRLICCRIWQSVPVSSPSMARQELPWCWQAMDSRLRLPTICRA